MKDSQRKAMFAKKKWGFDLTDFNKGGFQETIKKLGISSKPSDFKFSGRTERAGFVWEGDGIKIVTGNNPISGEYGQNDRRENEKNYASYIGIEGNAEKVDNAVLLIKKNTSYRKGESPNEREFI